MRRNHVLIFQPRREKRADHSLHGRILDPNTLSDLGPDHDGEICCAGPRLFTEYLSNPAATASSTFVDSDNKTWYRTGDQGRLDSQTNQLKITGRLKEIFKVGLEHVSPEEVETELLRHPSVVDAAVTAVPAREGRGDNECVAYVVLTEGGVKDARGIWEFMRERVAGHKVPTGGVLFCKRIPRNSLGKVVRRELGVLEVLEGSARYFEMD